MTIVSPLPQLIPAGYMDAAAQQGMALVDNVRALAGIGSGVEVEEPPEFRGAALDLLDYDGHEAIISGPYETGKTFAALYKLHRLLQTTPNARALMVRKTYKSIKNSAVVTYEQKVLPVPPEHHDSNIRKHGGESPEFYKYPNGARLIVGGMDNPDKFLSAEYDYIYVNQTEEISIDDWEKLTGRATGRAGNTDTPLVFGDCNPGPPTHWIRKRDGLPMFESRHEDNPMLYDVVAGDWTEQGRRTIAVLDRLTGLRKQRGRFGLWVAAEGQVYEYDPAIHELERDTTQMGLTGDPSSPIPDGWRRFRAVDFGYTNPFVCQWWAVDPDDRMYMYREIYMSQRVVRRHSGQINALSEGEYIETTVSDHDAEDRATMEENGISTATADKRKSVGIEKVEDRLARAGDGHPRIFFLADSLVEEDSILAEGFKPIQTVDEFASYVYPDVSDGKAAKEEPIKVDDHGMDTMRYAVMYLETAWLVA